jgi:PDZ domain-containing secreted protein
VPTPSACAFIVAIHPYAPGSTVQLTVDQATVTAQGEIKVGKTVQENIRLSSLHRGTRPSGCPGVTTPSRAYLGVVVESQEDFTYPFPVSVDTTNIGGPSAGLTMALGIIDKLAGGGLTGGAIVGATGTIDPEGNVGDVGGVPQKTVAVERAGATVFLVPPQEYQLALQKATPTLHVYAVATLDQALSVLARHGGHLALPAAPAPTARPAA